MTLLNFQKALVDAIRDMPYLNGVPVMAEFEGDVLSERDEVSAKQRLAVVVSSARFAPTSPDSRVITGKASLTVVVYENPSRNRIGQSLIGPTATAAAEAIACTAHLMSYDGGVVVFTGIGDVARAEEKIIAREVTFETLTTLTGCV